MAIQELDDSKSNVNSNVKDRRPISNFVTILFSVASDWSRFDTVTAGSESQHLHAVVGVFA